MKTTPNKETEKETVGRTYQLVRYGLHSRMIGSKSSWFGLNRYKSKEEAQAAMNELGQPILGGMVSFGSDKERFEYRIVRVEMTCTVEHVEERTI